MPRIPLMNPWIVHPRARGPADVRLSPTPRTWARHHVRGPADSRVGSAAHAHVERVTCVLRGLPRIFSGSRASSTRGQAPSCPHRRPPHPRHRVVDVCRRGGLHFGRNTALNRDLTAPNRDLTALNRDITAPNGGDLRCERCTVELGPRRGRQQTGGIAAIEVRHAGDTPAGCF